MQYQIRKSGPPFRKRLSILVTCRSCSGCSARSSGGLSRRRRSQQKILISTPSSWIWSRIPQDEAAMNHGPISVANAITTIGTTGVCYWGSTRLWKLLQWSNNTKASPGGECFLWERSATPRLWEMSTNEMAGHGHGVSDIPLTLMDIRHEHHQDYAA